jgi:hypothetical protein
MPQSMTDGSAWPDSNRLARNAGPAICDAFLDAEGSAVLLARLRKPSGP